MLFLLPALREQEKDLPSDLGKKPKRKLDDMLRYLTDSRVGLRRSLMLISLVVTDHGRD